MKYEGSIKITEKGKVVKELEFTTYSKEGFEYIKKCIQLMKASKRGS